MAVLFQPSGVSGSVRAVSLTVNAVTAALFPLAVLEAVNTEEVCKV